MASTCNKGTKTHDKWLSTKQKALHEEQNVLHQFYCALTNSITIENFISAIQSIPLFTTMDPNCVEISDSLCATIQPMHFGAMLRMSHIPNQGKH